MTTVYLIVIEDNQKHKVIALIASYSSINIF